MPAYRTLQYSRLGKFTLFALLLWSAACLGALQPLEPDMDHGGKLPGVDTALYELTSKGRASVLQVQPDLMLDAFDAALGDRPLDAQGKLILPDLLAPEILQRIRPDTNPELWERTRGMPNLGLQTAPAWYAFRTRHLQVLSTIWALEIDNPSLELVSIAVLMLRSNGQTIVESYRTGSALPFATRPIATPQYVFPVDHGDTVESWIVIAAQSRAGLHLPLSYQPAGDYLTTRQSRSAVQGAYYGLLTVMALSAFLIYISIRDRTWLFYGLFVVSMISWVAVYRGIAFQFLWPDWPELNRLALLLLLIVVSGTTVLFSRGYLNTREALPRWDRGLYLLAVCWALLGACAPLLPLAVAWMLLTVMLMSGCLILLVTGWLALRAKVYGARFYLFAWPVLLVGTLLFMATVAGWLPLTFSNRNLWQLGSVIESIVLSIGLGAQLHHKWKQRTDALEETVQDRTRALQNTLTELASANASLEKLSIRDPLTGLFNRRYLNERLNTAWRSGQRNGVPLSILLLDLDHFKQINDRYGHHAGDLCLRAVAEVLLAMIRRPSDTVARYGGEEMIVVLPDTTLEGARAVAESIRGAIEDLTVPAAQGDLRLTTSIGVASVVPDETLSIETLFDTADGCLYTAKANGRNQVCGEMISPATGVGSDRLSDDAAGLT